MNMVAISDKQKKFLTTRPARINLLEGSVRSGKTWVSLVAWALFVASMPKDAEFLMVGKTLTTLKRNCLGLLQKLEPSFVFSMSKKSAILYGRTIWLEGANDEAAVNKIRGMTLSGAYMDELTLIPDEFYYMVLSRLSEKGAKLYATTNPDSPANYVYTDIIENEEINRNVIKFLIEDNTFLEPEYVASLKKEYEAVPNSYQRYILGEWVLAEGLVYKFLDEYILDELPKITDGSKPEYYISVDYGTENPFSAGLWRLCGGDAVRMKEFYYNGRRLNVQKTDEEYCDEVEKLADGYAIRQIVVDPSAASFIAALRKRGFKVVGANNDVLDGIRRVAVYLAEGNIRICRCCKDAIAEFALYSWDRKASIRGGKDVVAKENDHAMDEIRYFANTVLRYKVGKARYAPLMY